jgi:hypothetical protein
MPSNAQERAALVARLVDEAQRRLTAAYLAHGHVYTEEPERTADILRDVLTRAIAALSPSPTVLTLEGIANLAHRICIDLVGVEYPSAQEVVVRKLLTEKLRPTASEGAQATVEAQEPTLSVWTPHPTHEMIRGSVCLRCCASLGTHTVTRPCSQPKPAPAAVREPEPSEALDLEALAGEVFDIVAKVFRSGTTIPRSRAVPLICAALARVKGQR